MKKNHMKNNDAITFKNHTLQDRADTWTLTTRGSIWFSTPTRLLKKKYESESLFAHPLITLFIMLACATLDISMLSTLFSNIVYDSTLQRFCATFGMFIAFDVAPIYLGIQYRNKVDGFEHNKVISGLLMTAFVAGCIMNLYLRYVFKDVALPASSFAGSDLTATNPGALSWAIFCSVLPVITSIVSFSISYNNYRPLLLKLKKIDEEELELQSAIDQTKSILKEYETEELLGWNDQRIEEENQRFHSALIQVATRGDTIANHVDEIINVHVGNAANTNLGSTEHRTRIEKIYEKYLETDQALIASILATNSH